MKFGVALLGAMLLAGCQSEPPAETNQAVAEPPANGVLAAATPGTRDWLIGTWVQDAKTCGPIDLLDTGFYHFEADGTYMAFEGGEGSWELGEDGVLALDHRDNDAVIANEGSVEGLRNAQDALVHETHKLGGVTPDGFTLEGTAFHRCPEQPGSKTE